MRLPDWQSRFAAVIKSYQLAGFEWGKHDCCLFVSDAIVAMVGRDPASEFRGKYDSKESGYALLEQLYQGGVKQMAERIADEMGFPVIALTHAQRGDVGLRNDPAGETLGLCLGSRWGFLTEEGMRYLPVDIITQAWRIG